MNESSIYTNEQLMTETREIYSNLTALIESPPHLQPLFQT